jgi:hypothetical protein
VPLPTSITVTDQPAYFREPLFSLLPAARNHYVERPALKSAHPAQVENTISPDRFKRIAEHVELSLGFGI